MLTPRNLQDEKCLQGLSRSGLRDVQTIDIPTVSHWPTDPNNMGIVTKILPYYSFWWLKTSGTWDWNPPMPACGAGGNGTPAAGQGNYLAQTNDQNVVAMEGCLVGYGFINNDITLDCIYMPKFDRSTGGTWLYTNDHDYTMWICWDVNDVLDQGCYGDNTGQIVHTLQICPPQGRK